MCMVEMAIFNIQRAITVKVGKQELRFMCSACHLIVVTFVSSFMKICQEVLKLWRRHKNCKHTKVNNSKSRKNQDYGSCVLHIVLWCYRLCEVS